VARGIARTGRKANEKKRGCSEPIRARHFEVNDTGKTCSLGVGKASWGGPAWERGARGGFSPVLGNQEGVALDVARRRCLAEDGSRKGNEPGPHPMARAQLRSTPQCQAGVMFSACGPFWPCVTSKFTFWPSCSSRKPWAAMFE
jgi:hypothetical protein